MKKPNLAVAWIDRVLTPYLPMWLVAIGVAMYYAFWFALGVGGIVAIAYLDLASLWGFAARITFGIATVLFTVTIVAST